MTRLLGLDLGGTNIKVALVEVIDGDAQVLHTGSTPTHAEKGPDEVTRLIVSTGRQIMDEFGDVEALGTAVPGLFDYGTGEIVFLTNLPGAWEGVPLRRRLAEEEFAILKGRIWTTRVNLFLALGGDWVGEKEKNNKNF